MIRSIHIKRRSSISVQNRLALPFERLDVAHHLVPTFCQRIQAIFPALPLLPALLVRRFRGGLFLLLCLEQHRFDIEVIIAMTFDEFVVSAFVVLESIWLQLDDASSQTTHEVAIV